jgi:acetylornithine/LysW-gamma-L-lysine aminotransferase
MNIIEIETLYTSGLYTKRPLAIVRGQGARLWDSDGHEYIDCVGGQGTANIGHANPQVAAAIAQQAATLISCPEMFYNDRRAALEERLCRLAGFPRVFLCNSGAEANEAAIKFARLTTGRKGILACADSTAAPSARSQPHGKRNTASRSSRLCPVSRMCPITTWKR